MNTKTQKNTESKRSGTRRENQKHPLLMKRGGTTPKGVTVEQESGGESGISGPESAGAELPKAITLPVETGKIKLTVSDLTPAAMLDLLSRLATGMASIPAYATLPVMADVSGARTALSTILSNLAALETQLKEARITLGQWMEACGMVLNRAALACENEDSSPSLLVTAGWTLRRGRSPAHEMQAPAGLRLKQTAFAGEGVARWRVVPNAKFYEVQVDPVAGAPLTIGESMVLKSVRASVALPTVAPGSLVTLCVRAVGAKGAGPFCDALTVRVN